jgi:hypothetical protein
MSTHPSSDIVDAPALGVRVRRLFMGPAEMRAICLRCIDREMTTIRLGEIVAEPIIAVNAYLKATYDPNNPRSPSRVLPPGEWRKVIPQRARSWVEDGVLRGDTDAVNAILAYCTDVCCRSHRPDQCFDRTAVILDIVVDTFACIVSSAILSVLDEDSPRDTAVRYALSALLHGLCATDDERQALLTNGELRVPFEAFPSIIPKLRDWDWDGLAGPPILIGGFVSFRLGFRLGPIPGPGPETQEIQSRCPEFDDAVHGALVWPQHVLELARCLFSSPTVLAKTLVRSIVLMTPHQMQEHAADYIRVSNRYMGDAMYAACVTTRQYLSTFIAIADASAKTTYKAAPVRNVSCTSDHIADIEDVLVRMPPCVRLLIDRAQRGGAHLKHNDRMFVTSAFASALGPRRTAAHAVALVGKMADSYVAAYKSRGSDPVSELTIIKEDAVRLMTRPQVLSHSCGTVRNGGACIWARRPVVATAGLKMWYGYKHANANTCSVLCHALSGGRTVVEVNKPVDFILALAPKSVQNRPK